MTRIIKFGYLIADNIGNQNQSYTKNVDIAKGMCPNDNRPDISSQNKLYSSISSSFLKAIREALIDNLYKQKLEIDGIIYAIQKQVYDFLQSVEPYILPDDIFDAIYLDKQHIEIDYGLFQYTNPNTKTVVVVDKSSYNQIVSIFPNGNMSDENPFKSKGYRNFTNNISIRIIKSTTYFVSQKGMGTACGSPSIRFEEFTIEIHDEIFDPYQVDGTGRTNLERMKKGVAPLDRNNDSVNLHHVNQNPKGPLLEIMASEHSSRTKELHTKKGPSEIDRRPFDNFRGRYWRYRRKRSFGGK